MLSNRLPVSSRPEFVALPSDPKVRLTPEQSASLWGGDFNILARMIIDGYRASLTQPSLNLSQGTSSSLSVPEGDKYGT